MVERRESVRVDASGESFKREFREFAREATELNAALRAIPNRVTVKAEARGLDKVEADARRAERGSSALADSLIALAPAAAPIGALVVPAVAGLTAQLGFTVAAAGTAVLAFHGVGTALKALDAYQLNPTVENLATLNKAMDALGPSGREFVHQLDALEPRLKGLKAAAENGLLPGVADGLDSLITRLPQVRSIIAEISGASGSLSRQAGAGLASGEYDQFFNYLKTEAKPILMDLGHTIGNITTGLADLLVATAPQQRQFSSWLLSTARGFHSWADGLENTQGFQDFMDYVDQTGPQVADAFESISKAVIALSKAAAPLGGGTLRILGDLADVIARIADSPLGTPLVALASGVALLNRALAVRSLGRDSLVAELLLGKIDEKTGSRGPTALARVRTQVKGLTSDLRTANSMGAAGGFAGIRAIGSPAELERQAAATGRLRERLVGLGKGAAVVGGLAFATSGLADKMNLANTASYAMLGTIGGPWGQAVGAGVGLALDFAHASDEMGKTLTSTDRLLDSSTASFADYVARRKALQRQVDNDAQNYDSINPIKGIPASYRQDSGFDDQVRGRITLINQQLSTMRDLANGTALGVGSVLTQGLSGPLKDVAVDFDTAAAASKAFYDSLGKFSAELNLRAALREQGQALDDFRKTLKANPVGKGGAAGDRTRQAALDAYAQAALNVANQTKNAYVQTQRLARSRKVFIGLAEALGRTPPQARRLADSLGLVDRRGSQAGHNVAKSMNDAGNFATDAKRKVHGFGEYFASLAGKKVKPSVGVQDHATGPLTGIFAYLTAVDKKNPSPKITAQDHSSPTLRYITGLLGGIHDKKVTVTTVFASVHTQGSVKKADGGLITGPGGPRDDRIPALLSNGEFVMNAAATRRFRADLEWMNAQKYADGGQVGLGGPLNRALFDGEGPRYYKRAYRHGRKFALDGPAAWDWPYQTTLSEAQSRAFEQWVAGNSIPFDPRARIVDYDMRGYWKRSRGRGHQPGTHFPDTWKTPYDTTFSGESKYATDDNPFYWDGNRLIDSRNGQLIFGPPRPIRAARGGYIAGPGGPRDDRVPAWLSNGEFVMNAAATARHREQLERMNAQHLAQGGLVGGGSSAAPARMPTSFRISSGRIAIEGGGWADVRDMHLIADQHVAAYDRDRRAEDGTRRVMTASGPPNGWT